MSTKNPTGWGEECLVNPGWHSTWAAEIDETLF